jgi:hypothetical protein
MPPAITAARTVAPREAAKRFDFIDDIWFLLLVSNKPEMVSATAETSGFGEGESETTSESMRWRSSKCHPLINLPQTLHS